MEQNQPMVTIQMSLDDYLKWKSEASASQENPGHSQKKYVYGLSGLQGLIGCSITTAWRIKNQSWIKPAISQIGRKIIIDADLAMQLIKENM